MNQYFNRKLMVTAVFIVCLIFPFLVEGRASGPVLEIREPVHDFKVIKGGEQLVHAFQVLNKGDALLEITSVKPS